jgi:hypothetical protein
MFYEAKKSYVSVLFILLQQMLIKHTSSYEVEKILIIY